MSNRLQTVLMWAIALLVVGSCGLSAISFVQGSIQRAQLEWGTTTVLWRDLTQLEMTSTRILATSYAQQTQEHR